ncbi:serine/threonine-protein kinase VRK1-like [Octopus vulgaris]|uniref:Serine/threonine-protein kinase VRK1-like n=2 Tax=Octopus TaxID=6643 RepID=A0AA36FFS1_OCTVU|nr:serine/threonine-protein kinase VRK2-like [Octopus sinensis]CAI9736820.1 serine/threonine-protein kinase VRK1-like [Octopus vulgaris]
MAKIQRLAAKSYKHAKLFPPGEVLRSNDGRTEFLLGKLVGTGGFGLIYDVMRIDIETEEEYVAKIEPIANGPLFNEYHIVQKLGQRKTMIDYARNKELSRHLAIPLFVAGGIHEYQGKKYRFIILPKYGDDLRKVFQRYGFFPNKRSVYLIAIQMLDALEYIHQHGYVHADIKAGNILLESNKSVKVKKTTKGYYPVIERLYLIDYGLAAKYIQNNKHKPYYEASRKAHQGTLFYTSIDAHKGVAQSRRGDLQNLGFCLLEWLTGSLPWKKKTVKDKVKKSKELLMSKLNRLSDEYLKTYFKYVANMRYEEKPNYEELRNLFNKAVKGIDINERNASCIFERKRKNSPLNLIPKKAKYD